MSQDYRDDIGGQFRSSHSMKGFTCPSGEPPGAPAAQQVSGLRLKPNSILVVRGRGFGMTPF